MTRKKDRASARRNSRPDPPPPLPRGLRINARQMLFVREFVVDCNGAQAYLRAYGETTLVNGKAGVRSVRAACVHASEMMRKPHVRAEIDAALAMLAARTDAAADRVIREMALVAFSDVGDYFEFDRAAGRTVVKPLARVAPEARRAIAAVEVVTERDRITGVEEVVGYKYKLHDKRGSLGDLAKHLNLFKEREPLDAILALLPADLAGAVRASLADALRAAGGGGVPGPVGVAAPVDALPRPADGGP